MSDPFGYYARKAAREAAIRQAAPYRIDDSADIIPDYDTLAQRLHSVGLFADYRQLGTTFPIYDEATGYRCGTVYSLAGQSLEMAGL